jgi:hypothetical protein
MLAKLLNRIVLVAALIAVSACLEREVADDHDPVIAAQLELCQEVCLKPFCDPALEPDPGVEAECETRCTEAVEAARDDECTARYQAYLECLGGISCEDFFSHLNEEPGAACGPEDDEVQANCPGLAALDEGG